MELHGDGIFVVPLVPDGWTAFDQEGRYYLEPPSRDAAVIISPYERRPDPLRRHEARDVVGDFTMRALGTAQAGFSSCRRSPKSNARSPG